MMRLALAVLSLATVAAARYDAECSEAEAESVSVAEQPQVEGRVWVRQCGELGRGAAARWELQLRALPLPRERCSERHAGRRPGDMHSSATETLQHQLNCTHVCMSRALDLVWRGCYRLYSTLYGPHSHSPRVLTSYHYISNNATSAQYFTNTSKHYYKLFKEGEEVIVTWYTGRIPAEEYEMTVTREDTGCEDCDIPPTHGMAGSDASDSGSEWQQLTPNCSAESGRFRVRCGLRLGGGARETAAGAAARRTGTAAGCYTARLEHLAPWAVHAAYQPVASAHMFLCYRGAGAPSEYTEAVRAGGVGPAVGPAVGPGAAVGTALLLAVAGAAVGTALLWKARRAVSKPPKLAPAEHPPLLPPAVPPVPPVPAVPPVPPVPAVPPVPRRILLLHGREPAAGAALVSALKELLEAAAPGQVCDLYSVETVSAAAGALGQWLRAELAAPGTRVLLLQTPALAARRGHGHGRGATGAGGEDGAAMYRNPHPMDAQLSLALRLLSEAALPQSMPYQHYFLATLSALPTETLPHVVPFARYLLPEAALRLLGDLGLAHTADQRLQPKLQAFENAVTEFIEYVRCNENYLQDELMFL